MIALLAVMLPTAWKLRRLRRKHFRRMASAGDDTESSAPAATTESVEVSEDKPDDQHGERDHWAES